MPGWPYFEELFHGQGDWEIDRQPLRGRFIDQATCSMWTCTGPSAAWVQDPISEVIWPVCAEHALNWDANTFRFTSASGTEGAPSLPDTYPERPGGRRLAPHPVARGTETVLLGYLLDHDPAPRLGFTPSEAGSGALSVCRRPGGSRDRPQAQPIARASSSPVPGRHRNRP